MADPKAHLDRAQIEHVAALASLSLGEAEAQTLAIELEAILRYVDELSSIDTTGIEPTSFTQTSEASWRADEVKPGVTHEEALAEAPRTAQGGFAVPGFVDPRGTGASR